MKTAEEILDEYNMDPERARTYLRHRPGQNNADVAQAMGVSRQAANKHYKQKFAAMSREELAVVREWAAFRDLEEMDVERQVVPGDTDEQ